jgi:predicted ribosomally synthesized peptide with SipW-like signal peptide
MKKKKNTREKSILICAVSIAGVMVAGSTFAWFTSKDEVTNRLSASASYNVTIAEDFTPPENWVPGQTIDKNVGVVNTGNTDAFVRAWLEGEMRLLAQGESTLDANSAPGTTAVTDQKLIDLGFTYSNGADSNLVYLKELDNTNLIMNPDATGSLSPNAYTEVMAVQAGGELASCPVPTSGASYKFTPNQAMSVTNNQGAIQHLAKDCEYTVTIASSTTDIIVTTAADGKTGTIALNSVADFRNIDSNSFEPVAEGLYIFKRNADLGGTSDDFEFSGYYVKKIDDTLHFFALEYDNSGSQRSSNVLSDKTTANSYITYNVDNDGSYTVDTTYVKLFAAKQETIENSALSWNLVKGVTTNGVTYTTADNGTTWKKGTDELAAADVTAAGLAIANAKDMFQVNRTTGAGSGVLINIALDNLGSGTGNAEKWTAITDAGKTTTFYYNNDLEEGATTSMLVDSVEMDSTVTQNDYIAFDFDLNVLMESVQVTVAENGDEGFTTVTPWAATGTTNIGANGAGTVTNGEIDLITWTKQS